MSLLKIIVEAIASFLRTLGLLIWNPIRSAAAAKGDAGKRSLVGVISIVLIVGASVSLLMTQCHVSHRADATPLIAIGQVVAEETAKLLDNKGLITLVIVDAGDVYGPTPAAQLKAFRRTLKAHPAIRIVATEKVRPLMPSSPETVLPGDLYLRIVREHPEADAIVSLAGAPVLDDKQLDALPPTIPKCIAVGANGANIKKLFQHGVIQVVIVSRFGHAQSTGKQPQTPREWFDQYFQVVTSNTVTSLGY